MTLSTPRRKRNRRDTQPLPMIVTERDKRIIEDVYLHRAMRQDQIHSLFFGASKAASQRRLALLYHHGFLERTFLTVRASYLLSPAVYLLDKRGAELLRTEFGYDSLVWSAKQHTVGQLFLEHTLAINDVRVAVTLACQASGFTLLEWRSESTLKSEYDSVFIPSNGINKTETPLIPDSFFVIQTPKGKAPFFLELDRGTETTKRFQAKIQAYQVYVQSGAYEKRYGYKSIRILTVTTSQKRLDGLKAATEKAGGKERFWFALQKDMAAATVFHDNVWLVGNGSQKNTLF